MTHGGDCGPTIQYATEVHDPPADRLLRRVVAGAAIVYGGDALVRVALHYTLARGWLASPPFMEWEVHYGSRGVVGVAGVVVHCLYVLGGALLLMRSRVSLVLLRLAVAATVVVSVADVLLLFRAVPRYASYWSTPGSGAFYTLEHLSRLWLPGMIGALTLGPLGERMTRR